MTEEHEVVVDETLEDGPLPQPTTAAQREALADQRFVHGLLRAMYTADASGREVRVRAVLDELPVSAAPRPLVRFAAAAMVMLAVIAGLVLEPWSDGLPKVDAMVEQALRQLSRSVNHRYDIDLALRARNRNEVIERSFELTVREGRSFLLRGDDATGKFECGSDGETLWFNPSVDFLRWSKPDRRSSSLGTLLSRSDLDQADLDLQGLIGGLDDCARTVSVQRVPARRVDTDTLVRVEARDFDPESARRPRLLRSLQMVAIEVDEATGVLERVEVVRRPVPNWDVHFVFAYRGTAELPEGAYARPW